METVAVTDLYNASYLLLSGCALTGIECQPTGTRNITCTMFFSGPGVSTINDTFLSGKAVVNLWAFRRAYAQTHTFINQAKKGYFRHAPIAVPGEVAHD